MGSPPQSIAADDETGSASPTNMADTPPQDIAADDETSAAPPTNTADGNAAAAPGNRAALAVVMMMAGLGFVVSGV